MAALSVQPVRPLWWGAGLGLPLRPCCRCPVCPGGEGLLPGRERLTSCTVGWGLGFRACSPAAPTSPMLSLDTTLQSLWNQDGRDGGLASSTLAEPRLVLPLCRVGAGPPGQAPGPWHWAGRRGGARRGGHGGLQAGAAFLGSRQLPLPCPRLLGPPCLGESEGSAEMVPCGRTARPPCG